MSNDSDWEELVDRHLRGELSETETERLAELLDSDASARRDLVEQVRWDTRFAEVMRDGSKGSDVLPAEPSASDSSDSGRAAHAAPFRERRSTNVFWRSLLAVSAVMFVALAASLYFQEPDSEPPIARITGLSGSLIWTGDAGRIERELTLGSELFGGTIEGMAPDSWFELEFNDGSKVMISGNSMLTFSDHGQKRLRLKEGSLSASVEPQPEGRPMLIRTPSARLEVLGTQFDVETGLASMTLNVSEGSVRVKRLSDGTTVDVPAKHRVTAAPDRDMSPVRVPDSVHQWKSQLQLGPDGTYGKWLPATDKHAARLKAIPMVPPDFPKHTLNILALHVSRVESSPVVLQPGSRFVVRGRVSSAAGVYFGIAMAHPNGEFAGKFRADKPASEFNDQSEFEAMFQLSEFALDPCVRDRKDELSVNPEGLVVTDVWCFTPVGKAGVASLEVTEVELTCPPRKLLPPTPSTNTPAPRKTDENRKTRIHPDRTACGDRHHRDPDRPLVAGRSAGKRGRPANSVQEPPQTDRHRPAQLP